MKIITEPNVYVLGRQTVDDGELNRFLADHGTAWESDSEVAAEVLAETAGRTCYMSFAKPRPGGNAAYLHHIKEARLLIPVGGPALSTTTEDAAVKHVPGLSVNSLGLRLDDGPGCSIVMGAFGSLYLHGTPAAIRALGMAVIAAADERPAAAAPADDAVVPIGTPDMDAATLEPATATLQPTSEG